MPEQPSYKGSVFVGIVDEVRKHLEAGTVSRQDAERFLRPDDLELLESLIVASQLYPLASYSRMVELLFQTVGGGHVQFLIEQGRQTASRLADSGIYSQMQPRESTSQRGRAQRTPEERFEAYRDVLEFMNTLNGAVGNFEKAQVRVDPDHPRRWINDSQVPVEYTDLLAWRSQGFRNELAARGGAAADLWRFERIEPTRILWRMTADVS